MYQATPTKLKSGAWGASIKTDTRPQLGTEVQVKTRAGKTWTKKIASVIYFCPIKRVALVETGGGSSATPRRRQTRRAVCPDCGNWQSSSPTCWETGLKH